MDNISDKIKNINKLYILGAVLGVSALGTYIYFKNKNTTGTTTKVDNRKQSRKQSINEKEDQYENQEKSLIRELNGLKKVIANPKEISYEGAKQIIKAQYELSKHQFLALTQRNREERRKQLGHLNEYQKLTSDYKHELDIIHNNHLKAILAHFKIEEAEWGEITDQMAAQHGEEWDEYLLAKDKEELDSIRQKAKPKLKLPMLIEIEKLKRTKLQQKLEEFKQTFSSIDPTDLFDVAQIWIADIVYEHFKVEEEDINYSIKQLIKDQQETLDSFQENVRTLMHQLIYGESASEKDQQD